MPWNSRERLRAALHHQTPDRTPVFEYVLLSPVADALLGRPYMGDPDHREAFAREAGWEAALRQEAADRVELALLLGHDLMYVVPPPPFRSNKHISSDSDLNKHSTPRGDNPAPPKFLENDPAEVLRRRNEQEAGSVDHPSEERFEIFALLRQEMDRREVSLPIFAPTYDHGVWTDTDLMMAMLTAPDEAGEHFALATRRSLAYIERYLQLGVELIGVGGDFAGNRPLISPELYREFIMPEVRALARRIRAAGAFSINASDGNLWPVIEDFLIGCEVDAYIEIDLYAGMDLPRLRSLYGGRVTFFGNLECGNILSFGTPEDVRRHTRECLEAGWGGGGHVLCASNAITSSVPVVNYLAVIAAYREFFSLPPLKAPAQ